MENKDDDISVGKWSTEKIDRLIKQIDESGVWPKNHPFFDKNVKLRKADVNWKWTKNEILEQVKIDQNILYFAETYAKVMTDQGQKLVKLRPYQSRVLLQFKKFRHHVWLASRQCGKCISSETHIKIYVPDKGILELPIFEAYYLLKNKLTILDRILLYLYRQNYKLYKYMIKYETEHVKYE